MKKINQNEWTQERQVVITDNKIFNIHKLKIKREMDINLLEGFSMNIDGKKPEFTIHFPQEYDYRLISDKRETIFKIL